ncbi:MAG TPA: hypothetical protein VJU86_22910 [Pyrinomonadaceae bacterium]|nr:hypothetical protein [Pyrinomonadaceae bacterium]
MEDVSQDIFLVVRNVLSELPSLLTLLVCLIIALGRWKRHPKVSLIASLTFFFLILHTLIFSAAYIWIPLVLYGPEGNASPRFYSMLALTSNGLFAVLLATLLVAVFVDRKVDATAPGSL